MMIAEARVAAVIAGVEANTVERCTVEDGVLRLVVAGAGRRTARELVSSDAAVIAFMRELAAARTEVTSGGPARSTSGS